MRRDTPYGEDYRPTVVDRFGIWLSSRRMRTLVGDPAGKSIGDFGCGYNAEVARPFLDACAGLTLVDIRLAPALKAHPKVTAIEGRLPEALASPPVLPTPPASVTLSVAVPVMVALSFAPVTVTSISWLSVPSLEVTVSLSCTTSSASSACVAARVLSRV